MAILLSEHSYCFIDHEVYLASLYSEVIEEDLSIVSLEMVPKIFYIKNNKQTKELNRKRKDNAGHVEASKVMEYYNDFIKNVPNKLKENLTKKSQQADTKEVRDLAQQLFETTLFNHNGISGGNNSLKPLKCKIGSNEFLIPQNSRFYCGCVKEQCQKLCGTKYDILLADPPWWNKYIRRLKNANDKLSYSMMYNEDIADIPIKNLLATNCLVAVWCTNAPSNIDAVKNLIFPKWGVEYVTTWYWLKVTIDLEPLCPFSNGCKKQPYERLLIGKVGQVKDIPDEKLIISIPSALHSHKPPVLDILKSYLDKQNPETLELFARYLLPNTTSVGYEPLKWQHMSLFELVSKDNKDHVT